MTILSSCRPARIFPVLRAGHIGDLDAKSPRVTAYFSESYDFSAEDVPDHFRKASLASLSWKLIRSADGRPLELWEPLWVRYLPHWIVLSASALIGGTLSGKKARLSFYAIENNDLETVLFGGRALPAFVQKASISLLGLVLRRLAGLVVFGTEGAAKTYEPLLRGRTANRLVQDLPARPGGFKSPTPGDVVFVGVLQPRKGIRHLMNAWEEIEHKAFDRAEPILTIIGGGELNDEVNLWAAKNPARRRAVGWLSQSEVVERLSTAAVLVAPSIPSGHWREQVGRPIREALSAGLTVVTSDQTGIAQFLEESGHRVVGVDALEGQLPAAIGSAINAPLPRHVVVASLPLEDGRLVADRILHEGIL